MSTDVISAELKRREFMQQQDVRFMLSLNYDDNIIQSPMSIATTKNELKKLVEKDYKNAGIEVLCWKTNKTFTRPTIFELSNEGDKIDGISTSFIDKMKMLSMNKTWMPFVVHEHVLESGTHKDFRFFVPNMPKETVVSYPDAKSVYDDKKLSGTLEGIELDNNTVTFKSTQPVDWLFFEGITNDGQFKILANGMYNINRIGSGHITIVMKSDNEETSGHFFLSKEENGWILEKIFRSGATPRVDTKMLEKIYKMRKTYSIKEISDSTGLTSKTVYKYLTKMNAIYPR